VQLPLVVVHAEYDHADQAFQVGPGQYEVRVRVPVRCWVIEPYWPAGQYAVCVSVTVSVCGGSGVQLGGGVVQVPASTYSPGLPSHTHAPATGLPVGLGQVYVRISRRRQFDAPVWPAGQAPV